VRQYQGESHEEVRVPVATLQQQDFELAARVPSPMNQELSALS